MKKLNGVQRSQLFLFTMFAAVMTIGHIASVICCPPWRDGEGLAVFGAGVATAVLPGSLMVGLIGWLDSRFGGRP